MERRIAEATGKTRPERTVSGDKLYCVIDISGGPNASKYPVSYLNTRPQGVWLESRTNRIVLRRIEPGSFIMGKDQKNKSHSVTITNPFYIGVFEVTQMQYQNIMGVNPSKEKFDTHPVEHVSYDMIRGAFKGARWPASSEVDKDSFLGRLRARTRIATLDLPTEAQWEYACRAGTTSAYNTGSDSWDKGTGVCKYSWRFLNPNYRKRFNLSIVGVRKENNWGLYDMHGNVREWCLNWAVSWTGPSPLSFGTNPKGPSSGANRVCRGGSWESGSFGITSYSWEGSKPSTANGASGFRLAIQPEE